MLQILSIVCLAAAASVAGAPALPSTSPAPAPMLPKDDPFYLPPAGWYVVSACFSR